MTFNLNFKKLSHTGKEFKVYIPPFTKELYCQKFQNLDFFKGALENIEHLKRQGTSFKEYEKEFMFTNEAIKTFGIIGSSIYGRSTPMPGNSLFLYTSDIDVFLVLSKPAKDILSDHFSSKHLGIYHEFVRLSAGWGNRLDQEKADESFLDVMPLDDDEIKQVSILDSTADDKLSASLGWVPVVKNMFLEPFVFIGDESPIIEMVKSSASLQAMLTNIEKMKSAIYDLILLDVARINVKTGKKEHSSRFKPLQSKWSRKERKDFTRKFKPVDEKGFISAYFYRRGISLELMQEFHEKAVQKLEPGQ